MNRLDPPLSTLVVLSALLYGLLRQGAYHEQQHQLFAVVLAVAGVLLLGSAHGRRASAIAAVAVLPLLSSSIFSWILSDDRSDARSTFLMLALVAVGLAGGSVGSSSSRATVEGTLVALAGIVSTTAIIGVAFHSSPWGRITGEVWRGSSSLTYANAAAAIVAPMALLSLVRSLERGSRLHAVTTTALLLGLVSTQSRGGALAFVVVALVVLARFGVADVARVFLPILAGLVIGAPLLLINAAVSSPAHPWRVLVAVTAGLVATAALWPRRNRVKRPILTIGAATGVVAVFAFATGPASLRERLTLRSGTTAEGADAEVLFGDRGREWATAWDQFVEQPLVGHGPGVVDLQWTESGRVFRAMFVHNEYLELLVTHGVVGLVAFAVGGVILWRRWSPDIGVTVALAAFLVHSSLDFLWHLPALPVYFAVLVGTRVGASAPSAALGGVDESSHAIASEGVG